MASVPASSTHATSTLSCTRTPVPPRELWKFCNLAYVEITAHHMHDDPAIDSGHEDLARALTPDVRQIAACWSPIDRLYRTDVRSERPQVRKARP